MLAVAGVLAPTLLPSLAVRHEPFVSLEHVNLNAGPQWTPELERFWFALLGAADDPRGAQVASETAKAGGSMKGLRWANFGLQQFHLPVGEPLDPVQRLRGEMALAYTEEELNLLRLRMEHARVPFERLPDGALRCHCPFGNRIRLEVWPSSRPITWFGPAPTMDPLVERPLPGGESRGLGLRWVRFDVPQCAAAAICRFYTDYFGAGAYLADSEDGRPTCRVPIGYEQRLEYVEQPDGAPPLAEYDGHHGNRRGARTPDPPNSYGTAFIRRTRAPLRAVALYVNRFEEIYERLAAGGLVWNNPRFPQLTYDTLDDARRHNEFRILEIVEPRSGEVIYTLEHEVRSLLHRGF